MRTAPRARSSVLGSGGMCWKEWGSRAGEGGGGVRGGRATEEGESAGFENERRCVHERVESRGKPAGTPSRQQHAPSDAAESTGAREGFQEHASEQPCFQDALWVGPFASLSARDRGRGGGENVAARLGLIEVNGEPVNLPVNLPVNVVKTGRRVSWRSEVGLRRR